MDYKRKMQMMVGRAVNEGYEAVVISGDEEGNMTADLFKTTPDLEELKDSNVTWFDLVRLNSETKMIVDRVKYEVQNGKWIAVHRMKGVN